MMGDRQWPDPRGWEALTQQQAEQDARERGDVGRELWAWLRDATRERDEARDALAAAVRERDQAREALRQAHVWVTDAIEEQGETDDDLLAQPGTMWVRLICARNVARAALDGGQT